LTPLPARVAKATVGDIARLGIIGSRARSILALAKACARGELELKAGLKPEKVIEQLIGIPGVGQWTANYIAMRVLRSPDIFLKEDIALRKRLGGVTAREAEKMSEAWRPWRSYAILHIWRTQV